MSLQTIYIARHGFRTNWTVDPVTGIYSSNIPSPTGIPADPALTAHGVAQSHELAAHLAELDPSIEAVYSSPYYRCIQTIAPYVELQKTKKEKTGQDAAVPNNTTSIRVEHGLGEWFGSAPFQHPQPAPPSVLRILFGDIAPDYVSRITPEPKGESLIDLYARVANALREVIRQCDEEGIKSVVICSHAAAIIAMGRVLTDQIPENQEVDDFKAFTCGLSEFRRSGFAADTEDSGTAIGGWQCIRNGDCRFLSQGEERGWKFAGDEAFPGTGSLASAAATHEDPKL